MAIKNIKSAADLKDRLKWILFLMLTMILSVTAQEKKESALVTDFFKVYDTAFEKVTGLAEAIPAEKYDWRPAEGVRSVKEVVTHLAGGNYYMASLLGTPVPEGIDPRNLDKTVKSKEMAISTLKASIDHIKKAINSMDADAFNQEVEFFGGKGTKRQVMLICGDHTAEHLGQLIAYARMNGITPPWSKEDN
jgi:uncharacterized damage-inducible protein DinB